MDHRKKWMPVAYHTLPAERAREVAGLRARCNAMDGLYLKIGVPTLPDTTDAGIPGALLVYAGDDLAGYCSLDGNRQGVEICGMVAPESRRQGVGTALLADALAYCRSAGVQEMLLICEEASAGGRAFAAERAGALRFAEHRMELRDFAAMRRGLRPESELRLRRAHPEDSAALARATARIFDSEGEAANIQADIEREFRSPVVRFYVGELAGAGPVSSLKLYLLEGQASIYAFGVLPEYRRRGLAWQMLALLTGDLETEGVIRIGLEVETENVPALALYQACGFAVVTTYGYYRLGSADAG